MRNGETTIVFLGDSITAAPDGYVRMVADRWRVLRPDWRLRAINAGVGGNRSVDLLPRLERDVLAYDPDIVTISIGINDVWRSLDSPGLGLDVALADYRAALAAVLDRIATTPARAILLTTSVIGEQLECEGNLRLAPYNEALRGLARVRGLAVADVNAAFRRALSSGHTPALTTDGVHLTHLGNTIMARAVLEGLGVLGGGDPR